MGRGADKLTSLVYGWSYANIRGQLVREGESRDVPDLTEDCGRQERFHARDYRECGAKLPEQLIDLPFQ